jgi:hypothetical protein
MTILGNLIHVDGWYIANHPGLTTLVIYGTVMQRKTVYSPETVNWFILAGSF